MVFEVLVKFEFENNPSREKGEEWFDESEPMEGGITAEAADAITSHFGDNVSEVKVIYVNKKS